eukprot:1194217-Prorocentrum_minimum.AAC.2
MCSSPHSFLTIADVKPTRAALYVAAQAPAPLPSQSTYFYHSRAKQRRVQSERQLGRRRRGTGSEPSLGTVVPGVTFHSLHLPELWSNSIPKHPLGVSESTGGGARLVSPLCNSVVGSEVLRGVLEAAAPTLSVEQIESVG